jgi:hypothetical protein
MEKDERGDMRQRHPADVAVPESRVTPALVKVRRGGRDPIA